jgi:hypothetical protein
METFENPLKRSKKNLYKEVKDKKYPYLDTPRIYDLYDINRITYLNGLSENQDFHTKLNSINSQLNKFNVNVGLIFTNYSTEFPEYLENSWRGGNPNDFVVILGSDKNNIIYVKTISWGNDYLKIKIRDDILNNVQNINEVDKIIDIVYKDINEKGFIEMDFHKFDYIKTEFPTSAIIIIFVLSIISSIIICEVCKTNEYICE